MFKPNNLLRVVGERPCSCPGQAGSTDETRARSPNLTPKEAGSDDGGPSSSSTGARRMGGRGSSVLHRTQAAVTSPAAVAEEPRMYFGPRKQAHVRIKLEIQKKKDELYDLINKGEESVTTSTWPNAWLRQYLAEDITPRPSDYDWCELRTTKRVISWSRRLCFFTFMSVAVDFYDDKKVALAMIREEEHEATEVETISRLMEMENWF